MYPTAFLPVFAFLVIYSLRSDRHWIKASILCSVFQAASPILFSAGGRIIGIAPAYALIPIGVWHLIGHFFANPVSAPHRARIPAAVWLLATFTIYGIFAALVFPRLFQGQILVLPPREGLDSGLRSELTPTPGNYIQSFYLAMNFVLFLATATIAKHTKFPAEELLRTFRTVFIVIAVIGIYQVFAYSSGLPWPSLIINSNFGIGQQPNQTIFGIKRMSSTFQEPSMFAMHLIGFLGLFLAARKYWGCLILTFICIALSTSSIGYFGAAIVLGYALVLDARKGSWRAVAVGSLVLAFVAGAWIFDENLFSGRLSSALIFDKLSSGSGAARLFADKTAMLNFADSYGLGVGVGSARASSFLTTLLATSGLIGFILFFAAVRSILRAVDRQHQNAAFSFAACASGILLGASLGVPDTTIPLLWILLGLCTGLTARNLLVNDRRRVK